MSSYREFRQNGSSVKEQNEGSRVQVSNFKDYKSGVLTKAAPTSDLFACSKCFSRHPFDELSQGKQLCKKCRGDFPVVKCTYCRSEFQQESKSKTSSICKRCEQNVKQYGKPSSCQFCQLPAAFLGGKCQRCSTYYKRYGPPKTCEQCKQKSAFDKGGEGKLMCWACSCSYKRALAKTRQSDPARNSRVFKKEPKVETKEERREKYMNSKKPVRPDVTQIQPETPPPVKVAKVHKERGDAGESDHVGEITQLKEKIASLQNILKMKDKELLGKDQEITQMKSKLFNEENLIRLKMKKGLKDHEDKVNELNRIIRDHVSTITRLKKAEITNKKVAGSKKLDLFSNSKKKPSRTASPVSQQSRSRSRSPVARSPTASKSPEKMDLETVEATEEKRSRSRSPEDKEDRSRSGSPEAKRARSRSASPEEKRSRSRSNEDKASRSRSGSPKGKESRSRSGSPKDKGSPSQTTEDKRTRSNSPTGSLPVSPNQENRTDNLNTSTESEQRNSRSPSPASKADTSADTSADKGSRSSSRSNSPSSSPR